MKSASKCFKNPVWVFIALCKPKFIVVLNFICLIAKQMQNLICFCSRWLKLKQRYQ